MAGHCGGGSRGGQSLAWAETFFACMFFRAAKLGEDPWGHSIQKLIAEIPEDQALKCMSNMIEKGAFLDRYYIPTRYPNGLPDLTPGKAYFHTDSEQSIAVAREIITRVKECIDEILDND
jgi:HEPN domain-containing protein